jgi:threonine aldolase
MLAAQRRSFLKLTAGPLAAQALDHSGIAAQTTPEPSSRVVLFGDGLSQTPADYAAVLSKLVSKPQFSGDGYLHGGPVEELERAMAATLGKERALFLTTGTLANHLAVRVLTGENK